MFAQILTEMQENEDEIAVVAKLTYNYNVGVITVYRLCISDYD